MNPLANLRRYLAMESNSKNPKARLKKKNGRSNINGGDDIHAVPIVAEGDIDRTRCDTSNNSTHDVTGTAANETQNHRYYPYFPVEYYPFPFEPESRKQHDPRHRFYCHPHYQPDHYYPSSLPYPYRHPSMEETDGRMSPFDDNSDDNDNNNADDDDLNFHDDPSIKSSRRDYNLYDTSFSPMATTPRQSNQSSALSSRSATIAQREHQEKETDRCQNEARNEVAALAKVRYDAPSEHCHYSSNARDYPYYYQYFHHAPYTYSTVAIPSKISKSSKKNSDDCKNRWYPEYRQPQQQQEKQGQQQAYSTEINCHYHSPSPPPSPPPYPSYYYYHYYYHEGRPTSETTSRVPFLYLPHENVDALPPPPTRPPSPPTAYSQYSKTLTPGARVAEDYYHPSIRDYTSLEQQHHYQQKRDNKEQIRKTTAVDPKTPSSRPLEKKREKIPNVTPLSNSNIVGRKKSSLPETKFVGINLPSSTIDIVITLPALSNSANKGESASIFKPSTPFGTLRDMDIVCGRGAPTLFHIGNELFRGLTTNYHTSYFCAKRSKKPLIAMKVLDVLQSRGARFVRRQKGSCGGGGGIATVAATNEKKIKEAKQSLLSSSFYWVEVPHNLAYEKVCQALRDGAPQVQRQMLSSAKAIQESHLNNMGVIKIHKENGL